MNDAKKQQRRLGRLPDGRLVYVHATYGRGARVFIGREPMLVSEQVQFVTFSRVSVQVETTPFAVTFGTAGTDGVFSVSWGRDLRSVEWAVALSLDAWSATEVEGNAVLIPAS